MATSENITEKRHKKGAQNSADDGRSMDPKTKQLVEEAERLVGSIRGPFLRDSIEESDIDFLENAPAKMAELCSAVREQDKRARHAEEERDAFDKRIAELEVERDGLIRETEAKAEMIANLVAKLAAVTSGGNVVPTNENFVRVAMVEHHGKSEMRPEYVREWARRLGPALDIIRARVAFKINELEAKLAEAVELAGEAMPYVSDYFRKKYEMDERLANLTPTDLPSPK